MKSLMKKLRYLGGIVSKMAAEAEREWGYITEEGEFYVTEDGDFYLIQEKGN